jgi:hypothetical protein
MAAAIFLLSSELQCLFSRMTDAKLFMLFLGCKPVGRHIEQHDVFFAIGKSLKELVPAIRAFWPESGNLHIDAWREVTQVAGHHVKVVSKNADPVASRPLLFFVNLGGYLENVFSEQHYVLLAAKPDKASAFREAKETLFFQHNHFPGANAHIDDTYGIDVDDLYQVDDILSDHEKKMFSIELTPAPGLPDDPIHLGYLKLSVLDGATPVT